MEEILNTAANCRHYAMCKIDFLGNGLCAPGTEKKYVSYYPQGRMILYEALMNHKTEVTERAADIASSCDLCGICNYQCYFVTEMKPLKVMKSLKDFVNDFIRNGGIPVPEKEDSILAEFRSVTGKEWATSDKAIMATYARDPSPVNPGTFPSHVVMPGSAAEVAEIMKIISGHHLKWNVRGNGSSVLGLVMSEGVVIDMGRMKSIEFDEKNWKVRVGAGVSAFDLQKAAHNKGYRVNVAEPSALVCANIMCSGIFSTFSASYGIMADNFTGAVFVSPEGEIFSLNDKKSPNLYAFKNEDSPSPGICVSADVKLNPLAEDETRILVPFDNLDSAVEFARECSLRRIGIAIGVLGGEYISTFMSPSKKLAASVKEIFTDKLRIRFLVQIIGRKHDIAAVSDMGFSFFDQKLFRTLNLGLPSLIKSEWTDLFRNMNSAGNFDYLNIPGFGDLAEAALIPSSAQLAETTDPEVASFFEKLYKKPHMTDIVWLSSFRIISSRMGREKHVVAWVLFMPPDPELIKEITAGFAAIAAEFDLKNDFGFITPLHQGKRCVYEYDYFLDQNDQQQKTRMLSAMQKAAGMIMSHEEQSVKWIRFVLNQGMARSESMLYS